MCGAAASGEGPGRAPRPVAPRPRFPPGGGRREARRAGIDQAACRHAALGGIRSPRREVGARSPGAPGALGIPTRDQPRGVCSRGAGRVPRSFPVSFSAEGAGLRLLVSSEFISGLVREPRSLAPLSPAQPTAAEQIRAGGKGGGEHQKHDGKKRKPNPNRAFPSPARQEGICAEGGRVPGLRLAKKTLGSPF